MAEGPVNRTRSVVTDWIIMKPVSFSTHRVVSIDGDTVQPLSDRLIVFLAVCAILYFGQDIIIPLILALLLAVLLVPVVRGLQKMRLPRSIAVLVTVGMTMIAVVGTAYMIGLTLTGLASDLPTYESALREKARSLKLATAGSRVVDRAAGVLKELQLELDGPDPDEKVANAAPQPIPVELRDTRFGTLQPLINMFDQIAHPTVQFGIVILMLVFILFNREDLRNRLIRLAGTDDIHRTTLALDEAGRRLSRLFLGQLAINVFTGSVIGVALLILGIPGAALWGLLTIVLRFIPLVGTLIGSVFPIVIAMAVGDGWWLPAVVAGVIIGAELFANQVLETVFLGRMTGLSSTAIVVSAAFWASLWGPIGLILATPITVGLLVIGRHIETLRFLDVMLGNEAVLSPDHAFYQRLLAGDTMEAIDAAQGYKSEGDLQGFLEIVAVPALQLAQTDANRGVLRQEKTTDLALTFSEALEEIWADVAAMEKDLPPVIVVAQPGVLNFAAATAFSALLTLKAIPHRMLAQHAVAEGRFPELDVTSLSHVCIVGLRAPSPSTIRYLERRIAPHIGDASFLHVAWYASEERAGVHTPASALSLLPNKGSLHQRAAPIVA
jgi:predicted PurR-regulated permease PerM